MEDSSDAQAPQGSSGIHRVTRSAITYIGFLGANYSSVASILSGAARSGKYEPQNVEIPPLDSMVMEMASCLEEKLAKMSQAFPTDQSLRFLFLLNNAYFMWQQLHPSPRLESHMLALTCKIDEHIRSYLEASWEPVLSCLHDPTPLCLGRYSPLAKFKLQFQKTSTAQKLWRVPDPELRRRLRTVIINKVN
ncbi:hypothetical protein HU200_049211 [Digitaria exilis]|uniref:Exocyst subunit Exo70 family protein n=1 Tax=Digitaria exilis TaxID=1010633 RepID=A0A835ATQ7_9POAL|nr:hypothetical protein HU200_049211 [Digitaria exilis]